ncbi:MAG TPA: type VI secretion system-associated FHA domain protein TagH [Noviherbaspirillum sp.]|nr:type VI secretion system-associated FHA domain protein TagH [Noviherbaspirillum sp.]
MLIRVLRYRGRAPDTITEAEFSEEGGTIGRSSDCTLSLPDPERHVSRVQGEIRWSDGRFLLLGRGTANPIERNGEPVAAGQSAELCDGDELHIGDYVLRVEFQQTRTEVSPERTGGFTLPVTDRTHADTAALFDTAPAARTLPGTAPDTVMTRLNVSQRRTVLAALQEQAPGATGNGQADGREQYQVASTSPATTTAFRSWDNPEGSSQTVIVGKSEPGVRAAQPVETPERIADLVKRAAHAHRHDFVPLPKSRTTGFLQELNRKVLDARSNDGERAASAPAELMQALLCGAGLPDLPASALDEETMLAIGALLRSFAQGFIDLLAARAAFKSEMRAEMTIISSEGNNPLKFSPDASEALGHLLAGRAARGYMNPEAAVQDAVNDLIAHQSGLLEGMRAQLQALAQRLAPEAVAARLSGRSMLDAMLPMNRKARLWELFEEIHADISREVQDETMLGREFVDAYEAQVRHIEEQRRRLGGR